VAGLFFLVLCGRIFVTTCLQNHICNWKVTARKNLNCYNGGRRHKGLSPFFLFNENPIFTILLSLSFSLFNLCLFLKEKKCDWDFLWLKNWTINLVWVEEGRRDEIFYAILFMIVDFSLQ
jgi:hypothetical protein